MDIPAHDRPRLEVHSRLKGHSSVAGARIALTCGCTMSVLATPPTLSSGSVWSPKLL